MAERAVLAREQASGGYAVATSRWGGTDSALAAVCAGLLPAALPGVEWRQQEDEPDFPAVVESLDVLSTELCYRSSDDEVTVFLPLWFGLPLSDAQPDPSVGALVAVASLADARTCRRWFRSVKSAIADAVTGGEIPWAAAPVVLAASIDGLLGRERYLTAVP